MLPNRIRFGSRSRIAAAALGAPWAIVPVIAIWILVARFDAVLDVLQGERYFFESITRYLTFVGQWTLIGIGFSYALTILYGIPIYIAFTYFEYERPMGFMLAGLVGGELLTLIWGSAVPLSLVFAASGASVGALFWLIAKK